jgi:hypothetical protein
MFGLFEIFSFFKNFEFDRFYIKSFKVSLLKLQFIIFRLSILLLNRTKNKKIN